MTLGATMTTERYDRAARPWTQFLPRMESLRPDRLVPKAKVSIPGRSSDVRLSVISRVLKQYVELATGDKFNFDGCSRGGHD